MPALGAPLVQHIELRPNESPVAILRRRTHRLGPTRAEGNPSVGPDLIDQVRHRDDLAGGRILNDGKVIVMKGRVIAPQQIERPGNLALNRVLLGGIALHPRVELRNRPRICRP